MALGLQGPHYSQGRPGSRREPLGLTGRDEEARNHRHGLKVSPKSPT